VAGASAWELVSLSATARPLAAAIGGGGHLRPSREDTSGPRSRDPTPAVRLTWTATDLGPAQFNAVACSAPTYCVALGPNGWMAWSDDGGAHWSTGRMAGLGNTTFNSVVCPSVSRCVAIGFETASSSGAMRIGVAAVSSEGGGTGHAQQSAARFTFRAGSRVRRPRYVTQPPQDHTPPQDSCS
jgi:hypothetical protein